MSSDFRVVDSYDNPVEANIVKGRLESEGIYCFLAGEHFVGLLPTHSNMAGGVRVFVRPQDFDKASSILKADREEFKKSVCCEVCGSDVVHYVSTKRDLINWLALVVSFLFLSAPPVYIKKVYKCDVCGYETENKYE